jgi:hypothetical protein
LKIHEKKFRALQEKSTDKKYCSNVKNEKYVKYVVNLSSVVLTLYETQVLQKGLNFAIAPHANPVLDIIKSVETASVYLGPEKSAEFKVLIKQAIEKHKHLKSNLSVNEQNAIECLKKNKYIIIRKADKGNVTVVLNKVDYDKKLNDLVLCDDYKQLKSDPTKRIEKLVNTALVKLPEINQKTRLNLAPKFCKPPHIYGLPKIHKQGVPLRPIVSSIGSPCHALAKYLVNFINPVVGTTPSFIKNSIDFVNKIQDIKIEQHECMVSFDVTSLFTCVPVDEALKALRKKLEGDATLRDRSPHSVDTLLELVSLCLKNTYFQFEDKFNQQNHGTAMDSPLSPVVCDI